MSEITKQNLIIKLLIKKLGSVDKIFNVTILKLQQNLVSKIMITQVLKKRRNNLDK
ncbi:MAG: hypothetical protein LN575_05585 [Rickettsia endosymbiont of Gnoriste bilineata]|nr:hypothetical protein [Rickettsia endosymbiont of Gnoriste bilineata]